MTEYQAISTYAKNISAAIKRGEVVPLAPGTVTNQVLTPEFLKLQEDFIDAIF